MPSILWKLLSFPTSKDQRELVSGDWYKPTIKVLLQCSVLCNTFGMSSNGRDLIYCWFSRMGAQSKI